jgi:photosystem II stability/assembly factor-like uncharacterized protein
MSLVYFIDETTGFVGSTSLNARIYRSTDGGRSWGQTQVPSVIGRVSSIWFSGDTGYAAIDRSRVEQGQASAWMSTDRGLSWFDISPRDQQGANAAFEAVDIVRSDERVALSTWQGGTWLGSPSDVPWVLSLLPTPKDGRRRTNGVATNGRDVVVTGFYDAEWYSHDGGLNWGRANDIPESWSVYSLANTRSFYTASEGEQSDRQRTIYRSEDGGESWQSLYTFMDDRITLNGHIDGKASKLYIQTDDSSKMGMYRSLDLGRTWTSVGGPSNNRDTRFSVVGCGQIVYAMNNLGELWKTTDGGDGVLTGDLEEPVLAKEDTVYIQGHSCQTTSITLGYLNMGCHDISIDSITVTGSADVFVNAIRTGRLGLWQEDSVVFHHREPGATRDTSIVTIYADNGTSRKIVVISNNTVELSFRLGAPAAASVSEVVTIPLFVSNISAGLSISRATFTLFVDNDLLGNWSVTNGSAIASKNEVSLDLSFEPALNGQWGPSQPIAILSATNFLAGTRYTTLRLDSANVTSSAAITPCFSSEVTYVQSPTCGDSTLRDMLIRRPQGARIYPNPVVNFLSCDIEGSTDLTVKVIDIFGRPCDALVTPKPGGFLVECSMLPAASYLLQVNDGDQVISQRTFLVAR